MRPIGRFLNDVILLSTPHFDDDRGAFSVVYEQGAAAAAGLPPFVQDNHSLSRRAGTVRGLHLQLPPREQGKLVRVVRGRIFDAVVDLRPGSPTEGRSVTVELAAGTGHQLWIPPGFAHGFCTLEPETEVAYKVDAPYAPEAERSLAWDDPTLAIAWPVEPAEAVLSPKDAAGLSLEEIRNAIAGAVGRRADEAMQP